MTFFRVLRHIFIDGFEFIGGYDPSFHRLIRLFFFISDSRNDVINAVYPWLIVGKEVYAACK